MASNGNNANPGGHVQPPAAKAANGAAPPAQDGDADNADAQSHISEPAQLADPPPVVGEIPITGPQLQVQPPPAKPAATAKQVQAPAVITQAHGAKPPQPPPQPVQAQFSRP